MSRGSGFSCEAPVPRRRRLLGVVEYYGGALVGRGVEANSFMPAGQLVGAVDGGVAGLAEEGVVRGAEPAGPLPQAVVAGSRRLASYGIRGLLLHDHCWRNKDLQTDSKFSYLK